MGKFRKGQSYKNTEYLGRYVIGVAAAIASISICLKVGIAPSIYKYNLHTYINTAVSKHRSLLGYLSLSNKLRKTT